MALRPELLDIFSYLRGRPCQWVSRKEVADALRISYSAARYRLRRLAQLGWIREYTVFPPRKIYYHYFPPAPPPPPPPAPPALPEEELIGDEECSGMTIYYHTRRRKYMVRHPKTMELIREEDKIDVELTGTVSTETGHDVPITLEISAYTWVREMGATDVARVERDMERRIIEWLVETGWGALARALEATSTAYNGERHVEKALPSLYPKIPEYRSGYVYIERRSRYVPLRSYEAVVEL